MIVATTADGIHGRLLACRLSRRRRSLKAPAGLGLPPALACGSDSAPAVRRISAAIEACGERNDGWNRGGHVEESTP